jgi:hypothetical protein
MSHAVSLLLLVAAAATPAPSAMQASPSSTPDAVGDPGAAALETPGPEPGAEPGAGVRAATEPPPELPPPLPPPPPRPPPTPRRYGDQGTPELALGFGYDSLTGFLAAGGFRYFVLDGVAPGVEGTYVSGGGGGAAYGLALGALRFVPLRTTSLAVVLTARGGRVLLAGHEDGWGLGGAVGLIVMLSPTVGLEVGYEALRLLPARFCADLTSCVLHGVVLGLRVVL